MSPVGMGRVGLKRKSRAWCSTDAVRAAGTGLGRAHRVGLRDPRATLNDRRMARGDLTDAQWARLVAVLPPLPVMGRKPRDRRQVFDGIW